MKRIIIIDYRYLPYDNNNNNNNNNNNRSTFFYSICYKKWYMNTPKTITIYIK